MESVCRTTGRLFPVVDKWVDYVHKKKEFSDIYDAMYIMTTPRTPGESSVELIPKKNEAADFANSFLRNLVLSNVFPFDPQWKKFFVNTFPGSKPTNLMKRNINALTPDYYLTPKGEDSVRCMMLSLYVSKFPRWVKKIRDSSNNSAYFEKFPMSDICAIHTSVNFLVENDNREMDIVLPSSNTSYKLERQNERFFMHLIEESEGEGELEFSKSSEKSDLSSFEIIKKYGKVMNYFCDEKFEFYYSIDDFVFPIFRNFKENDVKKKRVYSYQNVVLLDGELSYNLVTSQFDYRIFDVVTYCEKDKVISCLEFKLEDKLKIIESRIIGDYEDFLILSQSPNSKNPHGPPTMKLRMKDFFKGDEIEDLYDHVDSQTMIYTKRNLKNEETKQGGTKYSFDGVVIVPNSQVEFRFKSTKTLNLFYYKKPENRFVDLLILPIEKIGNENKLMKVKCLYIGIPEFDGTSISKTPNSSSDYFEREKMIKFDISRLQKEDIEILWERRETGMVCSCGFENGRSWFIRKFVYKYPSNYIEFQHFYHHKLEKITTVELYKKFMGIKYYEIFPVEKYRKEMKEKNVMLWCHVRRVESGKRPNLGHRNKKIQIEVNHFDGRDNFHIWKKVRFVNECVGPDFSHGTKLEKYVVEYIKKLENERKISSSISTPSRRDPEKLCVRVIYLNSGYYQILDFRDISDSVEYKNFVSSKMKDEEESESDNKVRVTELEEEEILRKGCSFSKVLEMLEGMVCWVYDENQQKVKRKLDDSETETESETEFNQVKKKRKLV